MFIIYEVLHWQPRPYYWHHSCKLWYVYSVKWFSIIFLPSTHSGPQWFWLLVNGYQDFFLRSKGYMSIKLITQFHLVLRLTTRGALSYYGISVLPNLRSPNKWNEEASTVGLLGILIWTNLPEVLAAYSTSCEFYMLNSFFCHNQISGVKSNKCNA